MDFLGKLLHVFKKEAATSKHVNSNTLCRAMTPPPHVLWPSKQVRNDLKNLHWSLHLCNSGNNVLISTV